MARKQASLGCLFWIALILLLVVVFLFNRTAIQSVLERTDLVSVLRRTTEELAPDAEAEQPDAQPPEQEQEPEAPAPGDGPIVTVRPLEDGNDEESQRLSPPQSPSSSPPAAPAPAPADGDSAADPEPASQSDGAGSDDGATAEQPAAPSSQPPPSQVRQREGRLFFVAVGADGAIDVQDVPRTIEYDDAPLTATLRALLAGPSSTELSQGYISLIPAGVGLNRVYVRDQVAYIDVTESFRFNRLGREGMNAQLQQLVFSATEFPTVRAVQILIEGEQVDYLGPEGVFIGQPVARTVFR